MHADGYAGFNELYRAGSVREVACLAHIRRKFVDVFQSEGSAIVEEALQRIAGLYAVEKEGRGRPPEERVRLRQARAKSILDELETWLHAQLPRISSKSELAKAIRYALARMRKLRPYLDQGCLEADNNGAERALKPVADVGSLCPSSSSIYKHWRLRLRWGAMRTGFAHEHGDDGVAVEILDQDLPGRTRHDLLGRQHTVLD